MKLNNIEDKLFFPEKYKNLNLFKNVPVCTLHLKREYRIKVENKCFKLMHNISEVNDDGQSKVFINDQVFSFDAFKGIIRKYVLVNCLVMIKPISVTYGGYFWGGFSNEDLFSVESVKNLWDSSYTNVKEGIRVLHIPSSFGFHPINSERDKYNIYIYTDTPITGEFEVIIIKNINYLPVDTELLIPKVNEELTGDYENRSYNNNIITQWKS
jgi:hypothetical protein